MMDVRPTSKREHVASILAIASGETSMRRTTVVIAALGSCASIVSASAWANGMTERVSVSSAGTQGNDFSEVFGGISADGRYVTFDSGATNLVPGDTNALGDVFVRDRSTGQTTLVSVSKGGVQGDSDSYGSTISADGRFVAFRSRSTNLLPGNPIGFDQAYVVDRKTGNLRRASVSASGTAADTNTSDAIEPPPLKWSTLRHVFGQDGGPRCRA